MDVALVRFILTDSFACVMFLPETPPFTTFKGFQVKVFRQGQCNLIERKLQRPVVLFVPPRACVGVFLPRGAWAAEEPLLQAAWNAQGSPMPRRPLASEIIYFGKILPIHEVPFAGYDDLWLEPSGTAITIAYRRKPDLKRRQQLLQAFERTQLLQHAEQALKAFLPQLDRAPRALVVHPLRQRILGQCTRDGEIRLNVSLLQWPPEILVETLAHELAHLTAFNHSPMFWRTLTALLPDWLPRSLAHYL